MRQYQVPQFIDVEDKIVGPLTIRQFLYLLAGGGAVVLSYYVLPFFLFVLIAIPAAAFAAGLAFVKVNGIPLPRLTANMIGYLSKPRLYLWKQMPADTKAATSGKREQEKVNISRVPTVTESKLQDIAWSLDIKEKINE